MLSSRATFAINSNHILVDVFGIEPLSAEDIEILFDKMCLAGRARLLKTNIHEFEGGGFTGVALLAESHISVHTWPEYRYASFDIYMCGKSAAELAFFKLLDLIEHDSYNAVNVQRGSVMKFIRID